MLTSITTIGPRVLKLEEKTQITEFYKSQSFKKEALIRAMTVMMIRMVEADTFDHACCVQLFPS